MKNKTVASMSSTSPVAVGINMYSETVGEDIFRKLTVTYCEQKVDALLVCRASWVFLNI